MIMDINSLIYPVKRPGTAIYNPVFSEMVFLHKGRNDFAEYVEAHLRQLNEYAKTARSRKLIHLPQVVKEIYDNALMMRESAQEDKLYELQLSDCDFNIVEELQEEVDMYDELLTRLEVVIENDYI